MSEPAKCPKCGREVNTMPRAGKRWCGFCGASWTPARPAAAAAPPGPETADGTLGQLLAALRGRRARLADLQLGPRGGGLVIAAGAMSLVVEADEDAELFSKAIRQLDRALASQEGS